MPFWHKFICVLLFMHFWRKKFLSRFTLFEKLILQNNDFAFWMYVDVHVYQTRFFSDILICVQEILTFWIPWHF